jgi:hypothetical protein
MDVARPEGDMSICIDGDAVRRAPRNACPFQGAYLAFATELIIVERVGLFSLTQNHAEADRRTPAEVRGAIHLR